MKKYMLRRRILALILVSIILLFTISVPIGAVVNGSVVPPDSTQLYGVSTFPYTVGFVTEDPVYDSYNYIFATQIGGYGLNNNQVYEGEDRFNWYFPNESDSETSGIVYDNVESFYNQSYLHWYHNNNGAYNEYYGGYGQMDLEFYMSSADFDGLVDSIIFKADMIFYNPIWLFHQLSEFEFERAVRTSGTNYMVPTVKLSTHSSSEKFVGSYSVEVYITDVDGEGQWYNYSVPIDTTGKGDSPDPIPFLSYDLLSSFVGDIDSWDDLTLYSNETITDYRNTTIMINQYKGYLDVDYYRLVNGSWVLEDDPSKNFVQVTYPTYNTSLATNPGDVANAWMAFPYASKYVDSVRGFIPEVPSMPEIPQDMYQDYVGWLAKGVGGFMNMQFAPGITIGGIVGVLVMFGCVMWMLKMFAGG